MAGYWLKLYTEILDDPKYFKLSDHAKLGMFELMIIAKKYESAGKLPSLDYICFHSRRDAVWWEPVLSELENINFIMTPENQSDQLIIRRFAERQAPVEGRERARIARQPKIKLQLTSENTSYDEICKDLEKKPGVYFIGFSGVNIAYIGASKNIHHRVKVHFSEIKNSWHPLYDSLVTYGFENIIVKALEYSDDLTALAKLEQKHINELSDKYDLINSVSYKPNKHWKSNACETHEIACETHGEEESYIESEPDIYTEVESESDPIVIVERSKSKKPLKDELKPNAAAALKTRMVSTKTIQELLPDHPGEKILEYCKAYDEMKLQDPDKVNPGWLVKAIREGWDISGTLKKAAARRPDPNSEQGRRSYVDGKYAEFIEH